MATLLCTCWYVAPRCILWKLGYLPAVVVLGASRPNFLDASALTWKPGPELAIVPWRGGTTSF